MDKFSIGDYITPKNALKECNIYQLLDHGGRVLVIKHISREENTVNYVGATVYRSCDSIYMLSAWQPHVDCITVSSLDYMTNKELTKEDKLIIKEALTNV